MGGSGIDSSSRSIGAAGSEASADQEEPDDIAGFFDFEAVSKEVMQILKKTRKLSEANPWLQWITLFFFPGGKTLQDARWVS